MKVPTVGERVISVAVNTDGSIDGVDVSSDGG